MRGLLLKALTLLALSELACARLGKPKERYILKLWKENEVLANGTESSEGFGYFVANVSLGSPASQHHMALDLTGEWTWVLSSSCKATPCREHRLYAPEASQLSVDVQQSGARVDPAGGRRAPQGGQRDLWSERYLPDSGGLEEEVRGFYVNDEVCLGKRFEAGASKSGKGTPVCTKVNLVAATSIEEGSVSKQRFDGTLGLAVPDPSLKAAGHFLTQLSPEIPQRLFGFFVADDGKRAEVLFGSYDQARFEQGSDIQWVPLERADTGYWMIAVHALKVGDRDMGLCNKNRTCYGMLQISSPAIHLSDAALPPVHDAIAAGSIAGDYCHLPDLTLDLEGGISLDLKVEDYAGADCTPEVRKHNVPTDAQLEMLLLGEPVFRRYYTVFDWENRRMGFGRSRAERHCGRLARVGLPTDECTDVEQVSFMQSRFRLQGPDEDASSLSPWATSWWGGSYDGEEV